MARVASRAPPWGFVFVPTGGSGAVGGTPLGHGGRGAPLVSFHVRPQYPESHSRAVTAFWSFLCSGPPLYRGGQGHRKLQIAPMGAVKRKRYRGRGSLSDQGGPPPTMPCLGGRVGAVPYGDWRIALLLSGALRVFLVLGALRGPTRAIWNHEVVLR